MGGYWYDASAATIKSRNNDDGLHLDWPTLPWKSAQRNEPTGWWDNQDRRNRHDTVDRDNRKWLNFHFFEISASRRGRRFERVDV